MASEIIVQTIKAPTSGANANKVIIPSGVTLDASGGGLTTPAGHVIQVVQAGSSSDVSTSSTNTWTDTNLFVDITPSSSNSKILVTGTPCFLLAGSGDVLRGSTRVMRTIGGGSATNVFNTDNFFEQYQVRLAANEHCAVGSITIFDTPNTTSVVRYMVQIYLRGDSGSTVARLWGSGRGSTMVAQEIAQ